MVGEGEDNDQLWGSGRSIAGCPWHLTQQCNPEKASRKAALSFLQTLHRYTVLYIDDTKIVFLLAGVNAGIIVFFNLLLLLLTIGIMR